MRLHCGATWPLCEGKACGHDAMRTLSMPNGPFPVVCDRRACRKGAEYLMQVLGIPDSEWRLGKTKMFVKSPEVLFGLVCASATCAHIVPASQCFHMGPMKQKASFSVVCFRARMLVKAWPGEESAAGFECAG